MSFVSSKGNILCRLVNIELYKIFAIINRALKGLHCIGVLNLHYAPLKMLVQLHQYSLWLTPMYLMSFCERYALNSSNLDHYSTEQSSVALGQGIDWDSEKFRSHMDVIQCFLYGHFYSCLALQIVSMEEWCYSAIKEHIWNIPTIFILQNVFTSKWFLDILTICMQICLTTYVAKTEKKQIHFCFPWYFQNGLIFLLRKK